MSYDFDTIVDRRLTNSIKWNRYPEEVLPLWVADMDFVTPEPILEALSENLKDGVIGYEVASIKLQKVVCARMDELYGWQIAPEMVLATPGVVSGFNAAARAVCGAGEGLLIQPPIYFPFLAVHENQKLTRQFAPLAKVTEKGILRYKIDLEAFEAAIDSNDSKTRMFLFCNPHNPVGKIFTREELSQLAEICLRKGVVICSDEIHSELNFGERRHIPLATLSAEIAEQTITLIASSKTFNTAGLFCGFAIIPNPELRKRYQASLKEMTLHVTSAGQIAAQAAYSGACDDWLQEVLAYLRANRDFVTNFVRENIPEIEQTLPDATFLTWFDCNSLIESGMLTGSPYEFFLQRAKVALSDGATFGPGGEGFVRLNFACPRSILEEALTRIKASLAT